MTLIEEPASVSLAAGRPASACELCASENVTSSATVVVQHPRGGVVQFAACDWCVHALRRLSAATGGYATFRLSIPAGSARPVQGGVREHRPSGPSVLIRELTQRIQDGAGTNYSVEVYGRERSDGTWEGWLEFVSVDGAWVLRTGRETTQSKREDLEYWASGLEPSYVSGAFQRARSAPAVALPSQQASKG